MCDLLQFTDVDYSEIMLKRFKNPYITPSRTELFPIDDKIQGLASDRYILKIYYQLDKIEQCESFFVKTMKTVRKSKELYHRHFEKEIYFYKILQKEFEELQLDTSFAPKCYLIKEPGTIVLENLKDNGYKIVDRIKYFNMEQIKSSLECLAAFHGSSFIYELKKGIQLNEIHPEVFKEYFFDQNEAFPSKWFENNIELWCKLADNYLENKEEFKKCIKKRYFRDFIHKNTSYRKICGHGDFWSTNILFKRLNIKKLKSNFVDFQFLRYTYPSFDVLLLIYFNTSPDVRRNHILELFDYYYEQLSKILSQNGYKIEEVLTKNELVESIDLIKYTVTLQFVSCHSLMKLDGRVLDELTKDFEGNPDRYDIIKETMETNEEYRIIILDCLEELERVLTDK